ncbi:putative scarecrow-like protein 3-like [Capsicum annuum]|nr:putative scarecrow-like protein 3-like [Capsicum annuum]
MASKISVSPFWNLPISTQKTRLLPQFPLLQQFPSSSRVISSKFKVNCQRCISVSAAVTEESQTSPPSSSSTASSSKVVLVVGGSGGVGQIVVASLLDRNVKLRLILRDPEKATTLFGEHDEEKFQYKKMGEDFVRNSGLPFTIIRAGRLTDGPYTSYDLNTLLQATAGERRAVLIGQGDKLVGEVSRLVVAEACIQALDIEFTEGQTYEINSIAGDGPGTDTLKWQELFRASHSN